MFFFIEWLLQEGQVTIFFLFCFSNSFELSNQPSNSKWHDLQFNLYTIIIILIQNNLYFSIYGFSFFASIDIFNKIVFFLIISSNIVFFSKTIPVKLVKYNLSLLFEFKFSLIVMVLNPSNTILKRSFSFLFLIFYLLSEIFSILDENLLSP